MCEFKLQRIGRKFILIISMQKNITLEIVFHGGLGNQLFQLYYAICTCQEIKVSNVIINKSFLKSYSPPRDFELQGMDFKKLFGCPVSTKPSLFSRLRLPKILRKLKGVESSIQFGRFILIDGYFQNIACYQQFDPILRQCCLVILRQGYLLEKTNMPTIKETLHHIRLGDGAFLLDPEAELKYLEEYIKYNNPKYIMSDKEDLVQKISAGCSTLPITIVKSNNLSAGKLLSKMGQFERVKTNGSTLALWASILYVRDFESSDHLCASFFLLFFNQKK